MEKLWFVLNKCHIWHPIAIVKAHRSCLEVSTAGNHAIAQAEDVSHSVSEQQTREEQRMSSAQGPQKSSAGLCVVSGRMGGGTSSGGG